MEDRNKRSNAKKWDQDKTSRKKHRPPQNRLKDIYQDFHRAASTGRKDDFETAVKSASACDNKYDTDYIGDLSNLIGCSCKFVRQGKTFTNSNGLKDEARAAFHHMAEKIENSIEGTIQPHDEPSQQCPQPEESLESQDWLHMASARQLHKLAQ